MKQEIRGISLPRQSHLGLTWQQNKYSASVTRYSLSEHPAYGSSVFKKALREERSFLRPNQRTQNNFLKLEGSFCFRFFLAFLIICKNDIASREARSNLKESTGTEAYALNKYIHWLAVQKPEKLCRVDIYQPEVLQARYRYTLKCSTSALAWYFQKIIIKV